MQQKRQKILKIEEKAVADLERMNKHRNKKLFS